MATTFENVTVLHDTKPTFTFSNPRLLLQAARVKVRAQWAAPSPAKREQRADRGGGVVRICKAEALPDKIAGDELHYAPAPAALDGIRLFTLQMTSKSSA
ncbi:MAG: hypothetical protein IJ982_13910, partial [Fibrobacter sp.]|nr:hypothetical protein [Fibrobacter sp.]